MKTMDVIYIEKYKLVMTLVYILSDKLSSMTMYCRHENNIQIYSDAGVSFWISGLVKTR
jgi:hypothetical protein